MGHFVLRWDGQWNILLVLKGGIVSVISCCVTDHSNIEWFKTIMVFYF